MERNPQAPPGLRVRIIGARAPGRYSLRARAFVLIFGSLVSVATGGCSHRFLSIFLDLPPPEEPSAAEAPETGGSSQIAVSEEDRARPPIEALLDPDTVLALLPKDPWGNVNWTEALRSGLIDPRASLPGAEARPDSPFGFDFYFQRADSSRGAFFPHSTHTEWMACAQCHTAIFSVQDTPFGMADVFQGRYCGECHGKVVFPATTCGRCHSDLSMPPSDATPPFPGSITMGRSEEGDSTAVTGGRVGLEALPPAVFPHWVHQVRYKCKVCHVELFEARAGANRVTMADISAGEACGRCHDGRTAFSTVFGECDRCHISRDTQP